MKRLTILRHAKSSWDVPGLDDAERPLNQRGRMAAKRVGEELRRKGIAFEIVLASPAVRVRETLERLQLGFGALPAPQFDPDLYGADPGTLLGALRAVDDAVRSVLLVGHNPGLQELVVQLAAPTDRFRGEVVGKFPTGAAALLEFSVGQWRDVSVGSAEILDLMFPRDLD
jgi:phosphohistidine phosphatase